MRREGAINVKDSITSPRIAAIITLVQYQSLEEAELKKEGRDKDVHLMEVEDECVKKVDDRELLALRRALSGQRAPNHEEQRENIFHKRCTINGRACSLTMDRGRHANVASTTLVDKLQPKAELRPQPYSIQWLDQGKGL